ncbi:3'-5' exonuclease [Blastococcus mobilis]|uniref:Exonuclease n=1 Tax=Blastococcus mobilis TaxID=1938746 RepID=A0A238VRW9_9ACTN|nr:3'-5' exonuclease [Blastococcus mobilis]SNR36921.1 Exonuclease [Blastococcus mobilis]
MSAQEKGAAYRELVAGREFVVLDIETTRTKATRTADAAYHPISVGAVVLLNGTRRATFHRLANPGVPVDKDSSAYNGIRTADLTGQPEVATVLAELDAFLARYPDASLVCHNALFDVGHLASAYARAGMAPFDRLVFDTEFLGVRLKLPGVANFAKLTDLATRYGIDTALAVPRAQARLHKALKDAQDTAEVLDCLLAEAALAGITSWEEFCRVAKPKRSGDIAATVRRRRRMRAPQIPAGHVRSCHGRGRLPARPSEDALDAWTAKVAACVRLHCPTIAAKVLYDERQAPRLLDRLTGLLATSRDPGDMGTLLVGLEPLLERLDRPAARAWYKANHRHIRDAKPCEPHAACPACVAGGPCPRDVIYQLLTRRALDYGTTAAGVPVSLLSKQVKKDLYYGKSARKIDTWPAQGLSDVAAHMLWVVVQEARAKHQHTTVSKLLASAVERDLQLADPHLALEVARHWARSPDRDGDVEQLVTAVLAGATSNPGYGDLEAWFHGSFRRAAEARHAAARVPRPRKADPRRTPADIELRPPESSHTYRYQLHRLPPAG